MARKRSPGGGRKPRGPFKKKDATLSTRITQDLLDALKAEADRSGNSLSQEVEVRLRASLQAPAELQQIWGAPHIQDLAELVSLVTRAIEGRMGADPFDEKPSEFAWHKNGHTNAAVGTAINALLAHKRPTERGPLPPRLRDHAAGMEEILGKEFAEREGTAEAIGLSCALGLLDQMAIATPPPADAPANHHYSNLYTRLPQIRERLK